MATLRPKSPLNHSIGSVRDNQLCCTDRSTKQEEQGEERNLKDGADCRCLALGGLGSVHIRCGCGEDCTDKVNQATAE